MLLTPRQKIILNSIVEEYVRLAEPVGSRALSKHWDIKLSPATIRNEMADLEELGFLEQPHTSAGRIPTQQGYRFYVDHLVQEETVDASTLGKLRGMFRERMDEVERVIQQAATALSQLTSHTSIVLGPKLKQDKVKHVQLVPLSSNKAVVLLVTDTGHVENRQIQMSDDISADDVVKMVNLLNNKLVGTPLTHMRSHLYREIANEMADTLEHYEDALALLDELTSVGDVVEEKVYVGGATQILSQPEFRDVDKVKPLLEMLESQDSALRVLPQGLLGLQVVIGHENVVPMLQDCSVISTTYTVDGMPVGTLGILGPTRMNYAHVMQMINSVSAVLTKVMTDRITGL